MGVVVLLNVLVAFTIDTFMMMEEDTDDAPQALEPEADSKDGPSRQIATIVNPLMRLQTLTRQHSVDMVAVRQRLQYQSKLVRLLEDDEDMKNKISMFQGVEFYG